MDIPGGYTMEKALYENGLKPILTIATTMLFQQSSF